MKKFTKILALALAVAMMLGMTSMAATLYLAEDFNYSSFTEYAADVPIINAPAHGDCDGSKGNFTTFNFSALRANSVTKMAAFRYLVNANTTTIDENPWGNKMVSGRNTSYPQKVAYIPSQTWNAKTNQTEKYVISFDAYRTTNDEDAAEGVAHYASRPAIGQIAGVDASGTDKMAVVMATKFDNSVEELKLKYGVALNTHGMYSGTVLDIVGENTPVRAALGVSYDAENAQVVKEGAANGVKGGTGGTYDGSDIETVDAFIYSLGADSPRIANLRMYTIDTTEAFAFTSSINGKTGVLPTEKITITFNQPIAAKAFNSSNVTITANGETVPASAYTATAKTVGTTVGGNIYSEAEITFNNGLALGTKYIVTLNVNNEIGDALAEGANTVSFETIPAPVVTINAYEGLTTGKAIDLENAAGKTVYITASVSNGASVEVGGELIIGVYEGTTLVKYAKTHKTLAANGTATFAAAFKLAAGQTVSAKLQ